MAYRLMYYTLQSLYIQLSNFLKTLTKLDKKAPEIQHALSVKTALLQGNHHQVFKLRKSLPNMGTALFKIFVPNLRFTALQKLYRM